jgi:hypothetical protein
MLRGFRRLSIGQQKSRAAIAGGFRLALAAFLERPQAELKSALSR